ncbi:MAG: dienelactone hydrolase family protein [Rhodospirillaceae bacterium]
MDQRIIELYDEYTHAPLPRRVFLTRLTALVGSAAAATALLPLLENRYAHAAIVAETDARIATSRIAYPGATGEVRGYMAMPRAGGRYGAVIVIHENRGLNPHIEDVARRLAVEGFLAMAPDALSPMGGTPADEDMARDMIGRLDAGQTSNNFLAAVPWMRDHGHGNGKVGCVGFCWGGAMANQLAVRSGHLAAAVSYYGRQPDANQVAGLSSPLLLQYAGLDTRINAGIDAFVAALREHRKPFEMHVYEGVNHAFNNDTNAARYNEPAARLAWQRTLAFLRMHLTA